MEEVTASSLDFIEAYKTAEASEKENLVENFLNEHLSSKYDFNIEFPPGKFPHYGMLC